MPTKETRQPKQHSCISYQECIAVCNLSLLTFTQELGYEHSTFAHQTVLRTSTVADYAETNEFGTSAAPFNSHFNSSDTCITPNLRSSDIALTPIGGRNL